MLTSIPPDTQLDAFRLHLVRGGDSYSSSLGASHRWIRRGLQRAPAAVHIRAAAGDDTTIVSFSPGSPVMASCEDGTFGRRLTTLRLVQVKIMSDFLKDLGKDCPVLEVLYMERCDAYLNVVASPTLRSLTMIGPSTYGTAAGPLRLMAPRLASMRLEKFPFNGWRYHYHVQDGAPDLEPLTSLSEASIRLTGLYDYQPQWQARKLEFLKSVNNFLALLPNVTNLRLSGFTIETLVEKQESLEFPVLHNLKTLLLEKCGVGTKFLILTSILHNTPSLEKLGLHQCIFYAPPSKKYCIERTQEVSKSLPRVLWCKKLKSIEIKLRAEDEPRMLKVLSEISERMLSSWWRKVKISRKTV